MYAFRNYEDALAFCKLVHVDPWDYLTNSGGFWWVAVR